MKRTKKNYEQLMLENPDITLKQLAMFFKCGPTTVSRDLKCFGLRTKPWSERKHSVETRKKIGRTRVERGVAKGENNPNFGGKPRPWLEGEKSPLRQWHRDNPDFGDRQRGAANPVHKVRHLYEDPEYVAKITVGLRAHVAERRGSTYEEVYGPEKAAEYRQKLRDASPARMAKFKRRETKPERIVRQMLEQIGIPFQQEAPLGFYTVDFLVPHLKVVILADGDYWHGNPATYPNPSPIQQKRRRLDASCNSFLRNRGYRLIRFWGSELEMELESCRQRLTRILHDKA